ncbi:MAG: hypothetical protein HYU36_14370 [Planctomycetes bacterium]|nr:hypothetical protein [Planctomycetota bacterium]
MDATTAQCGAAPAEQMLMDYYNEMVEPRPFVVRQGDEFRYHQAKLRKRILRCVGLDPLPDRIALEVEFSSPLEHPWCEVRAVTYRLWPGIRARALLYRPKALPERPAPGMLCPVGHWQGGSTHPDVQARCLNLARLGYVVLCTTQHHFEDLAAGFSHQTLMIWNNMRGLDLLEGLPGVDGSRLGCAGASGGGLQTQMLAALDERVGAATIVGLTCDYREILFPYRSHCVCNHWPGAMQFTDQPEIAALALPRPVQFLTMNDWTQNFGRDNLRAVRALYEAHGIGERVDHQYWPTPHLYDRPKRERTYAWMERWLRGGRECGDALAEPETLVFLPARLEELCACIPGPKEEVLDAAQNRIREHYRQRCQADRVSPVGGWRPQETDRQRAILRDLLGMGAARPRRGSVVTGGFEEFRGLALERVAFPSEGPLHVPTLLVQGSDGARRGIVIRLDEASKEARADDPEILDQARSGWLVVLPDVRFVGALSLEVLKGRCKERVAFAIAAPTDEALDKEYTEFWTRNGILWGRPLPGMAVTDLGAVLDGVLDRLGSPQAYVRLVARGPLAAAAVFAACLDPRIRELDVDAGGRTFAAGTLPLVPGILRWGDVEHWLRVARFSQAR